MNFHNHPVVFWSLHEQLTSEHSFDSNMKVSKPHLNVILLRPEVQYIPSKNRFVHFLKKKDKPPKNTERNRVAIQTFLSRKKIRLAIRAKCWKNVTPLACFEEN